MNTRTIRRHRRTLQEDKATMWWGKGKDMVGPEQCGGGRPLSRDGPRGFQGVFRGSQGLLSRCLCFSGWIWGDPEGSEEPREGVWGDPGVDLGASNGGWRVLGGVGFPVTLGCSRVDLGGLKGVGGLQRMSVGVLRLDFGVPGWTGERAVWRGLEGPSGCLGQSWEGEVSRLHLGAAREVPGSRGCLGGWNPVVNLRGQDVLE